MPVPDEPPRDASFPLPPSATTGIEDPGADSAVAPWDEQSADAMREQPVDDYLASCGLPDRFFGDHALRTAARRLLASSSVAAVPGDDVGAVDAPTPISWAASRRRRELLEVAVIRRFDELLALERNRTHPEPDSPRLHAAEDD
jgi:hypothetical protein